MVLDAPPARDDGGRINRANEAVHERRLANAGFSGDEDHLPDTTRGSLEPLPQLSEFVVTSDEDRRGLRALRERIHDPRTAGVSPFDCGDPPIAAPVHGLDEPCPAARIA